MCLHDADEVGIAGAFLHASLRALAEHALYVKQHSDTIINQFTVLHSLQRHKFKVNDHLQGSVREGHYGFVCLARVGRTSENCERKVQQEFGDVAAVALVSVAPPDPELVFGVVGDAAVAAVVVVVVVCFSFLVAVRND